MNKSSQSALKRHKSNLSYFSCLFQCRILPVWYLKTRLCHCYQVLHVALSPIYLRLGNLLHICGLFGVFFHYRILVFCCMYLVDWRICVIFYILLGVLILLQRKVSSANPYCCGSTVFRQRFYNGLGFTGQPQDWQVSISGFPDRSWKQCQKRVFLWGIFLSEYFFQKSHLIWKIRSKIHLPSPLEHLLQCILMMVTALIVKTCSAAALIWNLLW